MHKQSCNFILLAEGWFSPLFLCLCSHFLLISLLLHKSAIRIIEWWGKERESLFVGRWRGSERGLQQNVMQCAPINYNFTLIDINSCCFGLWLDFTLINIILNNHLSSIHYNLHAILTTARTFPPLISTQISPFHFKLQQNAFPLHTGRINVLAEEKDSAIKSVFNSHAKISIIIFDICLKDLSCIPWRSPFSRCWQNLSSIFI